MTDLQKLDELVKRVNAAQKVFATYSQEQVDQIFRAAALAAADARIPLATMAAEESGMGVIEDKVIKNHFSSEYIYNKYKDEKTCGVLEVDDEMGIMILAEPIGTICGVVPCTNPTSTTIFKVNIIIIIFSEQLSGSAAHKHDFFRAGTYLFKDSQRNRLFSSSTYQEIYRVHCKIGFGRSRGCWSSSGYYWLD